MELHRSCQALVGNNTFSTQAVAGGTSLPRAVFLEKTTEAIVSDTNELRMPRAAVMSSMGNSGNAWGAGRAWAVPALTQGCSANNCVD